jgi:hypothetical protein
MIKFYMRIGRMDKAFLFGPFVGEFYWEAARFATMIPYYRKLHPDTTFVIYTRPERFDLYGKYADILVPMYIEGDYHRLSPNCFRLDDYAYELYQDLAKKFKKIYSERFQIVNHLYPEIKGKFFMNKMQYSPKSMIYKYAPRSYNYEVLDNNIPKDKPIVIIAPRYRNNQRDPHSIKKRNWPYWVELYDMIEKSSYLMENFTFVLCGKPGEYVPDPRSRFYDINHYPVDVTRGSISGLLLALLERTKLTVASQSAIPNISLLCGVEVLEWGHQKELHARFYNPKKTPILFIDDLNYTLSPKIVLANLVTLLLKKEKKDGNNKQVVKRK